MTLVRRTSPLGELVSLRQAMDRLFEDSFVRPRGWGFSPDIGGALPLDVTNTPDALVVEAALPGIRPEDVEITVEDGTLSIRAESTDEREETQGESLIKEIRRGSLSRTVTLPTASPGAPTSRSPVLLPRKAFRTQTFRGSVRSTSSMLPLPTPMKKL